MRGLDMRRIFTMMLTMALMAVGCGCSATSFVDEFTVQENGWGEDYRDKFGRGYDRGEYYIELHDADWFAWAYPARQFRDAQIEVDAHLASGAADNHFGVICRYTDDGNFYYLAVSSDGYYGIFRRVDGGPLECISDETGMRPVPSAGSVGDVVRVCAACEGTELSLYLNGQWLASVTDDVHTRGYAGVGAGSGASGRVRIHFDNFSVRVP